MEKFVQNFEMNPYVRFPRPVRPYCKRSVLVETLEVSKRIFHEIFRTYFVNQKNKRINTMY